MPALYQLTSEYEDLALMLANAETPEDLQAFSDTLEGIAGEIKQKVLACAKFYRNLETEASVVKAEEERLAARRKTAENAAARMKAYMLKAMEAAGLERVKGDIHTVAIQLNPPKLVLDAVAESNTKILPLDYQKTVSYVELDRAKIKEDLLAGKTIDHCTLERGKSLRIR